jgi:hypothetical protein
MPVRTGDNGGHLLPARQGALQHSAPLGVQFAGPHLATSIVLVSPIGHWGIYWNNYHHLLHTVGRVDGSGHHRGGGRTGTIAGGGGIVACAAGATGCS